MTNVLRYDLFLKLGFLFGLVQVLTIFVSRRLKTILPSQEIPAQSVAEVGTFLLYLSIMILVFVLLARVSRARIALKIFWLLALFSGLNLFFRPFMRADAALLLALALVALYWRAPTIYLHNGILVLALPAIGSLFGIQLNPWMAVGLLLLFSVYDVIAVYGTKHMVVMAQAFIAERVIPGVIISEQRVAPTAYVSEVTVGKGFSVLGTGDLVFPAILVASTAVASVPAASVVALFSLFGLFLTHTLFFGQDERRPMPALPPIALMAIIGFLITRAYHL